MTDRPILFSALMVRALLAGTKTQTRRIMPTKETLGRTEYAGKRDRKGYSMVNWLDTEDGRAAAANECRYGRPGDRLWVREAWRASAWCDSKPPRDLPGNVDLHYEADGRPNAHFCFGKLRPSRFMPRAASRILLEVTDLRVERLQAISEADAIAEGCVTEELVSDFDGAVIKVPAEIPHASGIGFQGWDTARDWYADLWEEINGETGPTSWDANPWVWVVEFRRVA